MSQAVQRNNDNAESRNRKENRTVLLRRAKSNIQQQQQPQQSQAEPSKILKPLGQKRPVLGLLSNTANVQQPRQAKANVLRIGGVGGIALQQQQQQKKPLQNKKNDAGETSRAAPFQIHCDEEKATTVAVAKVVDKIAEAAFKCGPEHNKENTLSSVIDASNTCYDSPMILDTSQSSDLPDRSDKADLSYDNDYSTDIYEYLKELELKRQPKASYMKKQQDITQGMRSILVDWLVEVTEEYKLQTETLYLAINYIDRFLSHMSVVRGKLQLVGTACMFIAAKFEEIYPPEVDEFVYITDDTYTKKQVLSMEQVILKVLAFDLAVPTTHWFVQKFCKVGKLKDEANHLASYLCELALMEADPYLKFLPSVIAGSAVSLANIILMKDPWNEELHELTGYGFSSFHDCIRCLNSTLAAASEFPQQAIKEKYKTQKYSEVALLKNAPSLPF